jgi:hypothetical protein
VREKNRIEPNIIPNPVKKAISEYFPEVPKPLANLEVCLLIFAEEDWDENMKIHPINGIIERKRNRPSPLMPSRSFLCSGKAAISDVFFTIEILSKDTIYQIVTTIKSNTEKRKMVCCEPNVPKGETELFI